MAGPFRIPTLQKQVDLLSLMKKRHVLPFSDKFRLCLKMC